MTKLDIESALLIARGAQAKASDLDISISISIVDDAGRLILTLRGDDTGYLTTDTSRGKACAAAAFRKPTKEIVSEHSKNNSLFWSSLSGFADDILPTTGGYPIFKDGVFLGAIGCGGGTAEQDHGCAQAGASKLLLASSGTCS